MTDTHNLYDKQNLPTRLSSAMQFRNMSLRKVAPAIGISHATVHRIMKGGVPDVESYLRVTAWLIREAEDVIAHAKGLGTGG